jgi:hypothetical protein
MPERAGDQIADGREGRGLVPGADFLLVLAESLVAHVVLADLDAPVGSGIVCQVAGPGEVGGQAGDAVGDLLVRPRAVRGAGVAADADDLRGARPVDAGGGSGADAASFAAPVPGVLLGPGECGEVAVRVGQGLADRLQQERLVGL